MMKQKTLAIVILIISLFLSCCLYVHSTYNEEFNAANNDTELSNNNEEKDFVIFNSKEEAMDSLNNIAIEEESYNSSYKREEHFGSWKEYSGWSTRDEVLRKFGENTKDNGKSFSSGTWYVYYDGTYYDFYTKEEISNNLEIDHIVPLSYAYKHGADEWDQDKREEFCNDYGEDTKWTSGTNDSFDYDNAVLGNLIVSDKKSNRSKSDKGPSEWLPESNKLRYAEMWIDICNKYDISITEEDYDVIFSIINGE